jgi:hypothetical protein
LKEQHLGSVDELVASIESDRAANKPVFEYLGRQYLWGMESNKGKLTQISNDRYPQIQPLSLRQFLVDTGSDRDLSLRTFTSAIAPKNKYTDWFKSSNARLRMISRR